MKKKNGSSKNVQEVKVHPSQASARGASPREVQNLLSRLSTGSRKITKEKVVDCWLREKSFAKIQIILYPKTNRGTWCDDPIYVFPVVVYIKCHNYLTLSAQMSFSSRLQQPVMMQHSIYYRLPLFAIILSAQYSAVMNVRPCHCSRQN